MNKVLTATLAAVIAGSSLGVASAAEAQSRYASYDQRDQRYDHRDNRRDDRRDDRRDHRWDDRQDRREYRREVRNDRREYRQERRAYDRWQRAERRYNAARYQAPRGYAYQQWSYGQRLPAAYRDHRYVVNDYNRYGLRTPPHGYQYVRSGNDVVLAAVAGGLISAVIAGLFN